MDRSLLLVAIAGERAAIASEIIRSVVELDGITPVPRAPEHIAGLAALRSRAMTVVDCRSSLELAEASDPTRLAVVVDIEGFLYALLVDDVVTTGATIGEAARALREAGGEVLGAVAIAATPLRGRSGRPRTEASATAQ